MTDFFYLIPIALALGAAALGAFMWSLRSGQYDDLAGAAERILFNEQDSPGQIASSSRIDQAPGRNCTANWRPPA
ncbi:MAG: cbb3-type cytochrome oxidase assembly protein CcoS [Afipia sp.]